MEFCSQSKMWLVYFILATKIFSEVDTTLSCPDFQSKNEKISVSALRTMGKEDIKECLTFFGSQKLNSEEGKFIWDTLITIHGSVPEIPDGVVRNLGWVLKWVPVEDMANFTLTEVATISSLGQFRNLTGEQLEMLAERVLEDWANKGPQDYTHYDLITLGHILCGFNRSMIEAIHADSYKEAANYLATIQGCPAEQLEALAQLAQKTDAYGSPNSWSSTQLKNIGCVINGLDAHSLNSIPTSGFEAITPDIIPCIYSETLKVLSVGQLSRLTPSAVAALKSQQKWQFSAEQRKSVEAAFEGTESRESMASRANFNFWINLFITVFLKCIL